MPAFYAHRRFGDLVVEQLPGEMRDILNEHRTQFDLGCQGPDIYFFFRPWKHNAVNRYGEIMHEEIARGLFERGVKVIKRFGMNSATAAYVYGVVCHYALDSEAHPYVSEMMIKEKVGHIEIEEEFEKYCMRLDGVNPFSTDLSKMVPTDKQTVDAIKPLYPGATWAQTREALCELKAIKKIVCQPTAVGQDRVNAILRKAGLYEAHKGQMNQMIDNLSCTESNIGLEEKLQGAIPVAVDLIAQMNAAVKSGTPLGERFDRNFK